MCFNKNNNFFFQNANRLFELRIKIYRNLIFKGKNLKPEEFIAEKVKLKKQRAEEEKEIDNIIGKNNLIYYKKLVRLTDFKSRNINDELVKKHFLVQNLKDLLEKLQKLKSNPPPLKKKKKLR